ncbi:TOMM precursor leader peptide-binding protein [Streptomyces sp. MI02-7b]|uniref:TOMM precursor leader peptide-binding protein n=1 Tax=Streptomyces sp. MI02-7b TaxID=462941 RepID=UPI0029AC2758|nr:TOMM precursor leader peptide-binding protein [Streptomyces sp. MI02-7b]
MRPMLKPAMRRSWRSRESLQFGVDPAHAVVLDSVDGAASAFLDLLDGTRGIGPLAREAESLGLGPRQARRLLGLLAEGGVLDDASSHAELSEAMSHRSAALDRLRPDLAALSVVHTDPGGAAARIQERRGTRVRVMGAGRVGGTIAAVLSAAGVGRVDVHDDGRVEPWDTAPGGIPADHIGERRDAAARGLVRRAAPDPRAGAVGRRGPAARPEPRLSLVVIAPRDGLAAYAPDPREAEPLLAAGIPHLYAGVLEGMGVVGPLVVPGSTGCAGCLGLRMADADAAWPRVLAQLRSGRGGVPACDVALATTVAGLAAAHALAFVDGGRPPSCGARWELGLARLTTEVRPVPADRRCGCGATRELGAAVREGRGTMTG